MEMAMTRPAKFGFELDLDPAGDPGMRTDKLLFSESSGFVLEARPGKETRLMEILRGYNLEPIEIGMVTEKRRIVIRRAGETVADLNLDEAISAWTRGLAEAMK
jgi:phosphoribosylformylglycinamidine (FGAM) synthase-like enzyme